MRKENAEGKGRKIICGRGWTLAFISSFCLELCAFGQSTNKTFMLNNGTGGTTDNALPPGTSNFFVVNSNLMNQAVNSSHGGGSGGAMSFNQEQFDTNAAGQISLPPGVNTTNENAYNINIVSGIAQVTNLGASSNVYVGKTNFASYSVVTNRLIFPSDSQQIGDSSGTLAFLNPTSGEFAFGSSTFGASDGIVEAGTFAGAFEGNAAGATNIQGTNITYVFNTNALTTVSLLNGSGGTGTGAAITNWPVNFATNVYDLWISNSICISNCLNLVSNVNYVQVFLHNTNSAATYYLSFAGHPTLSGGLTNGWPLTNSLGDYWLQGTVVGTNWQTNTAHWALANPNY